MAPRDDVNTSAIAMVGLIGALLFFASIILLEVMFYRLEAQQRYDKDVSQPFVELNNLVERQQAKLADYRWVDEKKGVVAIPIDRAMELVVADLSKTAKPAGRKEAKP